MLKFLKSFFGGDEKKPDAPAPTSAPGEHPDAKTREFLKAIAEQKKTDPMIGLKIGAKEISQRLMVVIKNDQGVHVETLLSALAALGGFSCQMSLREEYIASGKKTETEVFTVVSGADGKKYYFGDMVNAPLAANQYSIYGLAAGALSMLGRKGDAPDVSGTFKHVAGTVGGPDFGIPRTPDNHKPAALPVVWLTSWPVLLPVLKMFCEKPADWPVLFGIAIQQTIVAAKDVLDPNIAFQIVMECAVPMSKVDPVSVLTPPR